MSREAVYQLVLRRAEPYRKARRKEKGLILDQLEKDTAYDRKTLIRLLKRAFFYPEKMREAAMINKKKSRKDPRGRPRKYDHQRTGGIIWRIAEESSLRSSPLILTEFIRRNMDKLLDRGIIPNDPEIIGQLRSISPSSLYRFLKEAEMRHGTLTRTRSYPKSHKGLRARIPHAITVERDNEPGHLQGDSCEHSGGFHEGICIHTLTITDIRSGLVMLSAQLGLSAEGFKELISDCLSRYPIKVKTFQTDGGPEFLNKALEDYTRRRGIRFMVSRPYRSNDQAHVEERHLHVVRAFVGRDRLDTQAELDVLLELYRNLELLLNFFTPTRRSIGKVKTRSGRLRSVYDEPKTPLERMLPYLPDDKAQELLRLREQLNPVDLKREIKRLQGLLGELVMAKKRRRGLRYILMRMASGDLNYETSPPSPVIWNFETLRQNRRGVPGSLRPGPWPRRAAPGYPARPGCRPLYW